MTSTKRLSAKDFETPVVRLWGPVDYDMYSSFRNQFDQLSDQAVAVIELSTLGGDPEVHERWEKTYGSEAR